MKRNIKLTPEQRLIEAAVKWHRGSPEWKCTDKTDREFRKAIACFHRNDHVLSSASKRIQLHSHVANLIEHNKKKKQDCITQRKEAITGNFTLTANHSSKDMMEFTRWIGRMMRKGAQYLAVWYVDCDCLYLASKLPVTARDVYNSWKRAATRVDKGKVQPHREPRWWIE